MAWTTPATATDGTALFATTWNASVRDNLLVFGSAWTAYGSGTSWTGATTNPVLGNGTWDGNYIAAGKLIIGEVVITAGSTTTYGAGTYGITLPVTPKRSTSRAPQSGTFWDTSLSAHYQIYGAIVSGALQLRTFPIVAGDPLRVMSPTVPVTMATGDTITISFLYESA